jgi:DNA-binding response OmpR family regulator|tara:strand:- start:181878 stop:182270 length:393 start_codon:yes stop_codon:yes gene_type:complete
MTDTKFILVVEDDPILKNLLGHTLAGKYQTLYANDGNEAIALFDQYKPAIVLLDLMLPTTDGFAVLTAIRAHEGAEKDTPVVVVSNLGQQKDIERAKSLGANDYLVKAEVSVEEIIAKIEGLISAPVPGV